MRIDVLTLFPEMVEPVLGQSIVGRAIEEGQVEVRVVDFREYSPDKHKKVDDMPFGGGPGMVLRVEPIVRALRAIEGYETARKIILTPQGSPYTQSTARTLSGEKHLVLLCGHYEGIDERVSDYFDEEVSIGDYVLTGGEIAALALIDSTVRLLPGVLHNAASSDEDTFSAGLLEYPQYTRPRVFEGKSVPEVLLSGHHEAIRAWRELEMLKRTKARRKDLFDRHVEKRKKKG